MPKISAGLLLFRRGQSGSQVMLVHPGGPFWAKKDDGSWSLPKGLADEQEDLQHAAQREFAEEIGSPAPAGELLSLGSVSYSNKKVFAWAIEADLDVSSIQSNTIQLEWPPKSGTMRDFPECDRAAWFDLETAKVKLVKGQTAFIERLAQSI